MLVPVFFSVVIIINIRQNQSILMTPINQFYLITDQQILRGQRESDGERKKSYKQSNGKNKTVKSQNLGEISTQKMGFASTKKTMFTGQKNKG